MKTILLILSFVTLFLASVSAFAAPDFGFERVSDCHAAEKSIVQRFTLRHGKNIYNTGGISVFASLATDTRSVKAARFMGLNKRSVLNYQLEGVPVSLEVTADEADLMNSHFKVLAHTKVNLKGDVESLTAMFTCELVSHKDLTAEDIF